MRALLFVLSEQQDCRPGAGYDGADDGVGGGDAAFHDAGDDKQGDGLFSSPMVLMLLLLRLCVIPWWYW